MDQVSRPRFGITCAVGLVLCACQIHVDDLACATNEDCPPGLPSCDQHRGVCGETAVPRLQPAVPDAGIAVWDEFVWDGPGWQ